MKAVFFSFFMSIVSLLWSQTLDTESIRRAVERQLADYPQSTLQDVYKSFYQNRFGTGHMISDPAATERYLYQELEAMTADPPVGDARHWEPVGADTQYVRVSLRAVADGKVTVQQLNNAFVRSAQVQCSVPFDWATEWQTVLQTIADNHLPVADVATDSSRLAGMSRANAAAHHSRRYNAAYHPHYRVVRREIFEAEIRPLF